MSHVTFHIHTVNNIPITGVNIIKNPKRAMLKQIDGAGLHVDFPFGPTALDFDRSGLEYNEVRRPGLKPLLIAEAPGLRTVSFTALLADRTSGGSLPIGQLIDDLNIMAASDIDCGFRYGVSALPYRVRITELSITELRRDPAGSVLQAEVSIQLTESPLVNQVVNQLSAVTSSPSTPATPSNPSSGGGSAPPPPASEPDDNWTTSTCTQGWASGPCASDGGLVDVPGGSVPGGFWPSLLGD